MVSKIAALSLAKQNLLCFVLGIIGALGFPPLHIIFAPFIAFPVWLMLTELNQEASWKRHFSFGFFFGLGYFAVGVYWITFSLGSDLSAFWWLVPFALFGIPAGLSVYVGVMAVLLKFTKSTGFSRCFWFAALWTAAEIAWGSGPLALPWNPLGSIWSGYDPILQSLSVIGIHGLTLLTALFVSFPILLKREQINATRITYVVGLFVIFAGTSIWGGMRATDTPVQAQDKQMIVRIVQPCVPLEMNWSKDKARAQLQELLELSSMPAGATPNIVIWPESALPLLLADDEGARKVITSKLPAGTYLMSGSLRVIKKPGEKTVVYNSLVMVDPAGHVSATYDKHHLVPFGEYLPLRDLIPSGIKKITSGEIDFSRGPGSETIAVDPIPAFSPLICFEGIFTGEVAAHGPPRPQWLLNITNDAWFGHSSGPYQHLQLARMRSIEEGIPLVRAANSGISAVFDAFGREVARKPLGEKGILDAPLPPALQEPTIFAKYGVLIFLVLMAGMLVLAIVTRRA